MEWCDQAKKGWYCTRLKGHTGPCAAKKYTLKKRIVNFLLKYLQ